MHIVPAVKSNATYPPEMLTLMARADGCPECVVNTEPPRDIKSTADGWMAAYLCNDCGHAWLTSWKD